MNAMVFAAGVGSRLRPLTDTLPKPLITVGGATMLDRTLLRLQDAGIERCAVNVHHLAPLIINHLESQWQGERMQVTVSDESDRLLDTGGGLAKAWPLIKGSGAVMVHNADILTDFPLHELIDAHRRTDADVTLLVSDRTTSRKLLFDSGGRMRGWTNVDTGEVRPAALRPLADLNAYGFCGIHILSDKAVDVLVDEYCRDGIEPFSITKFYIDFCNRLDIRCLVMQPGYQWFDIGKPATLAAARKAVE